MGHRDIQRLSLLLCLVAQQGLRDHPQGEIQQPEELFQSQTSALLLEGREVVRKRSGDVKTVQAVVATETGAEH